MKTINEKILPSGKRRLTIELDEDETILALRENGHYRLGHPMDDVIDSHIIADCAPVSWDSIEQKWLD